MSALLWLSLLCMAARIPMMLLSHGADYDMESYERVARTLSEGGNLYGDPSLAGRYPYFPAWGLLIWSLDSAARGLGLPSRLLFKLPGLLADLGITILIFRIVERLDLPGRRPSVAPEPFWATRPFWAAAAWAANPVAILISAGHGQFDSLALSFLLLSAWYFEFSEREDSDFASALSLGFSIAFKTWPAFFLPLFAKNLTSPSERRRYVFASLALPFLLLLPFVLSCGAGPVARALNYQGATAFSLPEALRGFFYGTGASALSYQSTASVWRMAGTSLIGLLWLAYGLGPWRFPLFPGLSLAVLSLYVLAPGLSPQYLCWLLPFALLLPSRLALRHTLVSLVALLAFYGLFMPEAFLKAGDWTPPRLPNAFFLLWALLNLGLWLYFVREWIELGRLCLRPAGRLTYR